MNPNLIALYLEQMDIALGLAEVEAKRIGVKFYAYVGIEIDYKVKKFSLKAFGSILMLRKAKMNIRLKVSHLTRVALPFAPVLILHLPIDWTEILSIKVVSRLAIFALVFPAEPKRRTSWSPW